MEKGAKAPSSANGRLLRLSAVPQFAAGPAETGERCSYIRLAAVWFQGAGLCPDWLFKDGFYCVFFF